MNSTKGKNTENENDSGFRFTLFETGLALLSGLALAVIVVTLVSYNIGSSETSTAKVSDELEQQTALSDIKSDRDSVSCDINNKSDLKCLIRKVENVCTIGKEGLCDADIEIAKIAWKYFENNYQEETGLVNAVNNFKSTTLWDTGSALAATIAARDFNIIDKKDFDDRIVLLLKSLATMKMFNDEVPNKVYNTKTLDMVDYANKTVENGIGVSILDMARLMSWLNTLSCMHPKFDSAIGSVLSRWDYTRIVKDDRMWGLARDKKNPEKIKVLQEGRLGYEQYAAKILRKFGFDVDVAASYENEYRGNIDIMGVQIAYDTRDPRDFHANNYVVTESYTMDAMESGLDNENTLLLKNIYDVQKKRWQKTGIVTAISEDNINQAPWFLYNTIFNAGQAWQTTNSSDVAYDHLKTVSTKAAITMAALFPEDEYSTVLAQAIESAYDPEKGWYSGIYENGAGYNTVVTANTNGVIMESLLYKKYGPLFQHCESCSEIVTIKSDVIKKAKSTTAVCDICEIGQ